MARKSYSEEFRRQAVDLYESTPGAALKGIAADLGIARGTLADRVRALGTGTTTAAVSSGSPGKAETPAAIVARLEARVAELEAEQKQLTTEKAILRQAAAEARAERAAADEDLAGRIRTVHEADTAYEHHLTATLPKAAYPDTPRVHRPGGRPGSTSPGPTTATSTGPTSGPPTDRSAASPQSWGRSTHREPEGPSQDDLHQQRRSGLPRLLPAGGGAGR
jgi:transposase